MNDRATGSSGNVFEDLGLEASDELMVKSQLAALISSIIEHRHLTQEEAARLLGTSQPKISSLVRGQLYGFSTERLISFLLDLGRDVEIRVRKRGRASERGRALVTA